MKESVGFARSLVRDAVARDQVANLVEDLEQRAVSWDMLGPLASEIDKFERLQIGAAYARVLGGKESVILRRQDFLARTAMNSILIPLAAFEDRLLHLIESRGLVAVFQHVIREFADAGANVPSLFENSGACRIAAFEIEDMLREAAVMEDFDLVERRNAIVQKMWNFIDPSGVPHEWAGVALLWVAALVDLGGLTDTETTEHFMDE